MKRNNFLKSRNINFINPNHIQRLDNQINNLKKIGNSNIEAFAINIRKKLEYFKNIIINIIKIHEIKVNKKDNISWQDIMTFLQKSNFNLTTSKLSDIIQQASDLLFLLSGNKSKNPENILNYFIHTEEVFDSTWAYNKNLYIMDKDDQTSISMVSANEYRSSSEEFINYIIVQLLNLNNFLTEMLELWNDEYKKEYKISKYTTRYCYHILFGCKHFLGVKSRSQPHLFDKMKNIINIENNHKKCNPCDKIANRKIDIIKREKKELKLQNKE